MKYVFFIGVLLAATTAAQAQGVGASSIINSPHNLSASGPGAIRAASEQQICIFCHTPHNAAPIQPLWNRSMPVSAYTIYHSRSLDALPGQPTGASKLCLSCHDGTIALGNVVSRTTPIAMAGGITTIPTGRPSNLGTDLSDDHPISFRYDTTLANKNLKIKQPNLLPSQVHLDKNQELQCTSCHDAHNDSNGKFLVMNNDNSQLCNSCHQNGSTQVINHQQCASCHQSHNAPSGPYLLKCATASDTCLACHNGQAVPNPGPNVGALLTLASTHDTKPAVDLPNPIPNEVTCADCHNPHTMKTGTALAPSIPPNFGQVSGISAASTPIAAAQYEYEVCFKCHAEQQAVPPRISRQIVQANTRLEFAPSAASYHPVEAAGRNTNVPSLLPGLTTASILYCNDCHNAPTGKKAGGTGPNGVHGSSERPLLIARYDTTDNTAESATVYALCYRCHDRNSILNDRSFTEHHKHVSDVRAPCSVCHDAHGISSAQGTTTRNAHLINFNTTVVFPNSAGKLYYESLGPGRGRCYLKCHNEDHNPETYP